MANELKHQTDIVNSVRRDGGYARKMSNRFAVGVPDLLVGLAPFAPCVIEVKDLGECGDIFSRQIAVTPKQQHEMTLFKNAYNGITPYTPFRYAAFILVAFKHFGEQRLIMLPHVAQHLTSAYEYAPSYTNEGRLWVARGKGLYYDIRSLLLGAGAVKVQM